MSCIRKVELAFILCFLVLAGACTKEYPPEDIDYQSEEEESDYIWNPSEEVIITLIGSTATVEGKGASVSGSEVRIVNSGNYRISGTLHNGRILVNSNDEKPVRIILDGVDITCSNSAAIFVKHAAKVIFILAEGSDNKLTDAKSYVFDDVSDEEPAAAIYSKSYLSFSGTGSLTVTGQFRDGIVGKDGLVIKSGTIVVTAADDGIRGKDYLLIHDGSITINAADDGLKSDVTIKINNGSIQISAGDDGIKSDSTLIINSGLINITRSYEGLESKSLIINGGIINLFSSDDGINAATGNEGGVFPGMPPGGAAPSGSCSLKITGGYIYVNSSGDGIDINGSVEMKGGTLIIDGPTANNNGAIDYDGTFILTGGTLLGIGSSGMAQAPGSGSTQNSALINFTTQQPAGTLVAIVSNTGEVILCAKNTKKFQSVVFSSADLTHGSTYDVYLGGSSTGELVCGTYQGGTYTPGTKYRSFTVSGILTRVQ